jgi:hypothetical protein
MVYSIEEREELRADGEADAEVGKEPEELRADGEADAEVSKEPPSGICSV